MGADLILMLKLENQGSIPTCLEGRAASISAYPVSSGLTGGMGLPVLPPSRIEEASIPLKSLAKLQAEAVAWDIKGGLGKGATL